MVNGPTASDNPAELRRSSDGGRRGRVAAGAARPSPTHGRARRHDHHGRADEVRRRDADVLVQRAGRQRTDEPGERRRPTAGTRAAGPARCAGTSPASEADSVGERSPWPSTSSSSAGTTDNQPAVDREQSEAARRCRPGRTAWSPIAPSFGLHRVDQAGLHEHQGQPDDGEDRAGATRSRSGSDRRPARRTSTRSR